MSNVKRTISRARHYLINLDNEKEYLDQCFQFLKTAPHKEREELIKESLKDGFALRHFTNRGY
jgi:hypothetical protein